MWIRQVLEAMVRWSVLFSAAALAGVIAARVRLGVWTMTMLAEAVLVCAPGGLLAAQVLELWLRRYGWRRK